MRKATITGGFLLLTLLVTSIGLSLTEPPQHQCDACGALMTETDRVIGDGWGRVEYQCPCGMRGTLAIRENGRETWWEWSE